MDDPCRYPEIRIAALIEAFEAALRPELAWHLEHCGRCRATLMLSLMQTLREAVRVR
jgi:hypothetical protein